jgi:hypothetical protein
LTKSYELEKIPVSFEHNGSQFSGYLKPVDLNQPPLTYHVVLNESYIGTLNCTKEGWYIEGNGDHDLAELLGEYLMLWFQ